MSGADATDARPPRLGLGGAGQRLGPYEIKDLVGAGGMGQVWRAHDSRLGRDVAVKVLPAAHDAEALRRFDVEARAASALNHPNILTVFDVGTHDGTPYVVCELLEGQTLGAKLVGPLPLRRALEYARQIADGLAAAHEKGIIHRDLKPENLFVTRDERVKILDFGLAKLLEAPGPPGVANTATGVVMGTAPYMSPEQVRGLVVDHRSDLFSFGAVLYEMVTGRRAFLGKSAADVMSAVLNDEPTGELPPEVARVIARCLEKSPALRFHAARDLGFVLEGLIAPTQPQAPQRPRSRRILLGAAVLALLAAALVAVLIVRGRGPIPQAATPVFHQLTYGLGTPRNARFAPDGRTVVYTGDFNDDEPHLKVYTVRLDSPESRAVPLVGAALLLSVSRTGELGFLRTPHFGGANQEGLLARVPLEGGSPRDVLDPVETADWAPDGDLAIVRTVAGKTRLELPLGRVLFETTGWISSPRVSPRGDAIAFLHHPVRYDSQGMVMWVDLQARARTLTRKFGTIDGLAWSPGGEIWFAASDTGGQGELRAVGIGGKERAVLVLPGLLRLGDISADGRVILERYRFRFEIYALAPGEVRERSLSWFDWSELRDVSSDGKLLLFSDFVESNAGPSDRVYLRSTDGSDALWLGTGNGSSLSPDGKWVLVTPDEPSDRVRVVPTGPGEAWDWPAGKLVKRSRPIWFPDGKRILTIGVDAGGSSRIYVQEPGKEDRAIAPEAVAYGGARPISADGKWIVAGGGEALLIYPVDGGEPRAITGLGRDERVAQWTPDGRLYVFNPEGLPCRIFRLDPATGQRELVREIRPPNEYARSINRVYLTPDASAYAYSFFNSSSDLYVVEGLR